MTQLRYRDLPAPDRDVDPGLRAMLLAAVSDAFYEARNAGRTMTSAADDAVERLLPIIASVDANAHRRGAESVADPTTVHPERTRANNPPNRKGTQP